MMRAFGVSGCGILCLLAVSLHESIRLISASDSLECLAEYPGACTIDTVHIDNHSWIDRLTAIITNDTESVTIIKRCQLYNRIPVQKMLIAMSQLFRQTTLQQYYEQDFTISNRMASESMELLSAPFLKRLAILPNLHLRSLFIVKSAVQRIPATISNLKNLRFLGIDQADIRMVDLGLLCALPNLKILQLDRNRISLLLPAPPTASCVNSLREVNLNYNQLTALDFALFAPFVYLERLFVEHNRMHSIVCSSRTNLPLLSLIMLGPGNYMPWVALELLQLPALVTINMQGNQLKRLPYLNHSNILHLNRVYLDGNKLSTVDIAHFKAHQHLDGIHVARNQLHSLSCRQFVHLPMLTTIAASRNLLESISLENCSFPNLSFVSLTDNRFQRVPAEICFSSVSHPVACMLSMDKNPLQCSSIQQYIPLLTSTNIVRLLTATMAARCIEMNYTGGIPLSDKNSVCCMR